MRVGDHLLLVGTRPVRGLSSEAVARLLREAGSAIRTRVRLIVARPVPSSTSPVTASQIELSRFYSEPHDSEQHRPQTPDHIILNDSNLSDHHHNDSHFSVHLHNSHSPSSTTATNNNTNNSSTARSAGAPASAPLARRVFYSSMSSSMPMAPLPLVPTERLEACVLSLSQLLADTDHRDASSSSPRIHPLANCTINCNTHNTHQNHTQSLKQSPVQFSTIN